MLERMRSVTQHLSAMIEEILAFTSLEEGREIVRPTEFLAADLVRAAAAVVEPLARQKKLGSRSACPADADPHDERHRQGRGRSSSTCRQRGEVHRRGEVSVRARATRRTTSVHRCATRASGSRAATCDACSSRSRRSTPGSRAVTAAPGSVSTSRARLASCSAGASRSRSEPGKGSTFTVVLRR